MPDATETARPDLRPHHTGLAPRVPRTVAEEDRATSSAVVLRMTSLPAEVLTQLDSLVRVLASMSQDEKTVLATQLEAMAETMLAGARLHGDPAMLPLPETLAECHAVLRALWEASQPTPEGVSA